MAQTALHLALAPALIGASSLAARRWGERAGGLVSAFPAIAGPFLLIAALEHGAAFAAAAADATLLGLVALSAFSVAYAHAALRVGWAASLLAGWAVAALLSAAGVILAPRAPVGLVVAVGSLLVARAMLPAAPPAESSPPPGRRSEVLLAMALGALLIATLTLVASRLGSLVAGVLAGLPVLASVLVAFAHRRRGALCALELLRGMLAGMAGFVLFCEIVAVLILPGGTAIAFASAGAAALVVPLLLHHARKLSRAPCEPEGMRFVQPAGPTAQHPRAGGCA